MMSRLSRFRAFRNAGLKITRPGAARFGASQARALLMAGVFAAAAGLGLLVGPHQAAAFQSGNWSGGAQNDHNGKFLDCSMSAGYRSGITLGFIITRNYDWGLDLYNPAWSLVPNSQEKVVLSIDRRGSFKAKAKALTAHAIVIPLDASGPVVRAMRHGSLLHVYTGSGHLAFALTGTSTAIRNLALCVDQSLRQETAAASGNGAFASMEAKPHSSPATSSDKLFSPSQAVVFASNLLSDAGIQNYTILDPSKNPMPGFDVVWTYQNGTIGALAAYKNMQNVNLNAAAGVVIADDSKSCDGDFASGKQVASPIDSVEVERLFTACRSTKNPMVIHYTLFKTKSGHLIQIARIELGNGAISSGNSLSNHVDDAFLDASVVSDMNK